MNIQHHALHVANIGDKIGEKLAPRTARSPRRTGRCGPPGGRWRPPPEQAWVNGGPPAQPIISPWGMGPPAQVILPGRRSARAAHDVIAEGLESGAGGRVGQPSDLGPGYAGPVPQIGPRRL